MTASRQRCSVAAAIGEWWWRHWCHQCKPLPEAQLWSQGVCSGVDPRHNPYPARGQYTAADPHHGGADCLRQGQSGKIAAATPGKGTTSHLTSERFQVAASVKFVQVPCRGSVPALQRMVAGASIW